MCTAFAAVAALTAASSFATFLQQSNNAKALEQYQRFQFEETKELARADSVLAYTGLNQRQAQERVATGVEVQRVAREARRAIGTARASSTGVAGQALDNLVRDFELKSAEYRRGVTGNLAASSAQLEREKEAVRLRQRGRVLAATPAPVNKPSFLGAALRAGTSITSDYYTFGPGSEPQPV